MKQTVFGKSLTGEPADRFVLENAGGMRIEATNFGALVLAVVVRDKNGVERDVALGFDCIEEYFATETGMGAYVGRNANRIQGAEVEIEGAVYGLDANEGRNTLHSGFDRSHCKLYAYETGADFCGQYVEFYRLSPHLEQGFPGNLEQRIRYTLTEQNEFLIDYVMRADRSTVVNPTNHTYFNLNGHDSGSILGHELEVYSDGVLDIDAELIPTGEILDVTDTPMDFRQKKQVGRDIESNYRLLQCAGGYDHNYVFENDRKLKVMARLYGEQSGIEMTVLSDLCGLQVYSGNFLRGERGKGGAAYTKNSGICLETQFYPNACKEPRFPSPLLKGGQTFRSRTVYRFVLQ